MLIFGIYRGLIVDMIVHFIASSLWTSKNSQRKKIIAEAVQNTGHSMSKNSSEIREVEMAEGLLDDSDWENICREELSAADRADLLIVEASNKGSFGVGYVAAVCLDRKKPTLLLLEKGSLQGSFINGLKHPLLTRGEYDAENLAEIVIDFIQQNTVSSKDLRFNFVIDRQIYNYLRWRSHTSGKTKAEVVRDLLLKDIYSKN